MFEMNNIYFYLEDYILYNEYGNSIYYNLKLLSPINSLYFNFLLTNSPKDFLCLK